MPPMMPPQNAGPGTGAMPPRPHPNVDPNNQFQAQLLQRLRTLSPEDKQALMTGISPAAMAVLGKVLPELGHLMGGRGGAPAPGAQAAPGGAPQAGGATTADAEMAAMEEEAEQPEAPAPPDGATPLKPGGMRSKSKLAAFGA